MNMEHSPQFENWIDKGIKQAGEGNLEAARASFHKAKEADPDRFEVYSNLGAVEQLAFDHQQALLFFDKALEIDPFHTETLYNKGISLSALRRFEEALNAFDKALEVQPDYSRLYMAKGYALMESGRKQQAQALFETFLQLSSGKDEDLQDQVRLWLKVLDSPHIEEDHLELLGSAREALDLGDGRSALELLDKFLDKYPSQHVVISFRAFVKARMDNAQGAAEDSNLAEKMAPHDPLVFYWKGKIALAQKEEEKARQIWEKAQGLKPRLPEIYTSLAEIEADPEKQFQLYSQAITLHPSTSTAFVQRGKIFQEKGKVLDALSDFSKALRLEPDQTEVYQWIEDILGYLGDHLSTHDQDPTSYAQRAQAFMNLERFEDALSDWQSAMQLDPDNPMLIRGLATALFNSGQGVRAWELLTKAIGRLPDIPELRLDRAKIGLELMRSQEAEEDLIEALNLDNSLADAHFLKGQLHASREEWLAAETHFGQAQQLGEEHPELFRQLALIAIQNDQLEKSLDYFEKGMSLGINPAIMMDAAHVAQALERPRKALTYLDEALSYFPNLAEAWQLKTMVHHELEEKEEAYRASRSWSRYDPLSLEAWQLRMELATELRAWEDALGAAIRLSKEGEIEEETLTVKALSYFNLDKKIKAKKELVRYQEDYDELPDSLEEIWAEVQNLDLPQQKKKPWWKWK